MKKNVLLFFSIIAVTVSFAQITVDETLTTQQLVEDILINSPCAEVSNFSQSTGTDFGQGNGIGAFNANGSTFPFNEGVILSSGFISNAPGPNNSLHSDGTFTWPGDADLEANTTATSTNNASWIQFDFVPFLEEISFNFIMASEEYNQNFECSFSDAFAFILTDQTTGTVQNLAVLPGTTTPIEVTNIRYEVSGQCPAINEQFFGQYNFQPIANPLAPSIPAADSPIDFNGQTVSLTAVGTVTPGNDYTIKLVVADETDTAYDISVYLEAGSFDLGNVNLGDDITLGDPEAQCEGDILTLDSMIDPADATFKWFADGTEIIGETGPTLDVSITALYAVEVTYTQGSNCVATDEILVEFFAPPAFDLGADQQSCFLEPVTLDATPINYAVADVNFQWFMDGVAIPGETNPTYDVTTPGFYEAEVSIQSCIQTEGVNFENLNDIDFELGPDSDDCFVTPVLLDATPTNYALADASFQWFLDGNLIPGETGPTLATNGPGTYEAVVSVGTCENTDSVTLSNSDDIDIELGDDVTSCFVDPVLLDATPSNYNVADATFEWSLDGTVIPGETNATLNATEAGTYSVLVTVGTCEATDSVTLSQGSFTVDLGEDFETCFENSATLTAEISGEDPANATYQWFVNGVELVGETSSSIPILEPGDHSVVVTIGSCVETDEVFIGLRSDVSVSIVESDFKTCPEELNILTAVTDEENATFQWFKNGNPIPNETNSTLEFSLEDGESGIQTFSVVITLGDCTAEDDISIQLYDIGNCAISQGISPNGDGFNDILDLEFLSDRTEGIADFKIYNRHGLLVFEQTNYINEWFGQTDEGDELPTGTYYVIMTFNQEDPVYGNQYAAWIYLNRDAN
ncbi:choice-of-anchor L domain-containing protein [Marinirhabdus gelatinilytica]|uniref:Gliding motility-associated-like protein n=1 Tax=Marinirhabdus gelatinilytica TaxID=1703343 RepID=A0A370QIT1_9FLAO|nr:choice-of-anchor L domain-containing protein [Marinirhabdus gelatinilytica]RDK88239.1 gliding motility-associated-like protein [Marinirhabdus gelatinilytica]